MSVNTFTYERKTGITEETTDKRLWPEVHKQIVQNCNLEHLKQGHVVEQDVIDLYLDYFCYVCRKRVVRINGLAAHLMIKLGGSK